jgi:hypothetical protein
MQDLGKDRPAHGGLCYQNSAISVAACSGSRLIVSRAEEAYSVPTTNPKCKFRLKCEREVSKMQNRSPAPVMVLVAAVTFSALAFGQNAQTQHPEASKVQNATAAPAPFHDISGTWEPAGGPGDGIQPYGVKAMPNDGKPEHQLPYTPYGLQTYKSHRALIGPNEVHLTSYNDPRDTCEPLGFPRANFYNLRETQIMQNEYKVAILYEYGEAWRVIWTDGRELPKLVDGGVLVGKEVREPRFYGYSVGKWVDDSTLVVQTVGMMAEDRVWLDGTGRPISDQLRVEERFHRVNHDRMELTVTIDDPKMYTKPWIAMNKFPLRLQDPHYDVTEMYCSPSEMEKYNKLFGSPASEGADKPPGQ